MDNRMFLFAILVMLVLAIVLFIAGKVFSFIGLALVVVAIMLTIFKVLEIL